MEHAIYTDEHGNQKDILFDDLQAELLDSVDSYDKTYKAIGYDKRGE